ncbi:MAG: hypothetical protein KBS83_09035 [Lachnospiraceae bacterium]|nr:hypothetical protein [Candidatus Equihabitans merdae]
MNTEEVLDASDLEDPTLPVVSCDVDGYKANLLYGYLDNMQPSDMRQGLIPVNAAREIGISYIAYGNNIRTVSYEITAPDTGEVVANAKIGNFKADGDYMTARFTLNGSILMNREYPIRFTLETDKGDIYYYARLLQRSQDYAADYLSFVNNFYETCFNKEGGSSLNVYMETSGDSYGTTNFANVSLKSPLDTVTWGSLNPQICRKAVPTIS